MSGVPTRTPDEAAAILADAVKELASRREALGEGGTFAVAAWSLTHAWEFEAAEIAWARVLEHEPRALEAVYQRGMALIELSRFDDAAAAFRHAIELDAELRGDPNSELLDWIEDDPSYRLGNCHHASGDLERAIVAYEESARRNTVAVDALREIARCRLAREEPREALAALRRLDDRVVKPAVRAEVLALRADAERMLRAAEG
jgi:tetratricopeptide (TPR) repeat protein